MELPPGMDEYIREFGRLMWAAMMDEDRQVRAVLRAERVPNELKIVVYC